MVILDYRKSVHFMINDQLDHLLELLPESVHYNAISQACDVSAIVDTLTLDQVIAALSLYIKQNYTGPDIVDKLPQWAREQIDVEIDGETGSFLARGVPLLFFARDALLQIKDQLPEPVYHWWSWRYAVLMQQLTNDRCPSLMVIFEEAQKVIESSDLINDDRATMELYLAEYAQSALVYYKYEEAQEALKRLEATHGVNYNLSGAMGKRTKHQTRSVPQLYIEVSGEKKAESEYDKKGDELDIVNFVLDDDYSLKEIKWDDESITAKAATVTANGAMCALIKMVVLMGTGPTKDRLNEEEQLTYLNFVLNSKCASPSTVYEALRLRSKLEVYKFAQAERGMKQVQALAALYNKQDQHFSLQHFFCARLLPRWQLKRMLCDMFVKLGCTKSALDEYLSLEMFTDACYTYVLIDQPAEAAKLAETKLNEDNITDLQRADYWCVLGDINNDKESYEKAWRLSGERHARSMRSLGTLLVHKKRHSDAADAFNRG